MGNQPNIVKLLLAAGADVNVPDEDDLTPLHVAARLVNPIKAERSESMYRE